MLWLLHNLFSLFQGSRFTYHSPTKCDVILPLSHLYCHFLENSCPEGGQVLVLLQHVCVDACFHHLTYPTCLEFGATSTFSDRVDPMVKWYNFQNYSLSAHLWMKSGRFNGGMIYASTGNIQKMIIWSQHPCPQKSLWGSHPQSLWCGSTNSACQASPW